MKFKKWTKRLEAGKDRGLAVLIDPDKFNPELVQLADKKVSCFLVGGSVLEKGNTDDCVKMIKKISKLPVILFPGDFTQLTGKADGLFFLSLLSGRNPEYLIGQHVKAAKHINKMALPSLPVAYLLLGKSHASATRKVTGTRAIPFEDRDEVLNTCLAAQLLGFRAIYLEAGSGANSAVPPTLIRYLKKHIHVPLIVGGGINSGRKANLLITAGADLLVVGNALEKNVSLISELVSVVKRSI
jgi:putative glycerol-1-phosphate prenyltransferase